MADAFDYDLICIGSGPAGQRAAIQAAKLGKRAAVIERQRTAGGICIDTGTIPSKTFREAVRRVYSRPGLESTDNRDRVRPTMEQLVEARGERRPAGERQRARRARAKRHSPDPRARVVQGSACGARDQR